MERSRVRLLMVEDSAECAAAILRELADANFELEPTHVQARPGFLAALQAHPWDLVICAHVLPSFSALEALDCLHERSLDIPLIVVAGKAGEANVVEAMRRGARDYLASDDLARLPTVVRRELREAAIRAERRREEDRLRAERAMLRGLVRSAMDAIITLDSEQKIVLFNPAAELMFGWKAEKMLGNSLDRLLPQSLQAMHRGHIAQFGASGTTSRTMGRLVPLAAVRANGEEFPIEATISQTSIEGRRYYMVIVRDISERRRLEAELLQAQKMEAIGRLAGGVAHDFNNLLTAIMGYSELALMDANEPERIEASVMEIRAAAERAAGLTRQLLTLSRRSLAAPASLDLGVVISEIERMLQRLIGLNYELRTEVAPGVWPIRADRGQIEQVIMNLVVNAQDAMPYGGRITIHAENQQVAPGDTCIAPGAYAVLSVSDDGVGMDEETQRHIFEPFYTTKDPGRGTGLGLAIVRSVTEQAGGTITVKSAPGEGTTFCVYLPRDTSSDAERDAFETDVPLGTETLLLMEADASVRQLEQQLLSQHGYRVLPASDAREAQEHLRSHAEEISLLVTNVVLVGMRGAELAEMLREFSPGLKVLFLAGYNDEALMHEVQAIGAALLEKPFGSVELARAVRSALDG
ncbi:MAG: ATP-binding protein [Dehalococcoidia bacterium]|nr:ATP-binding protein [Dehalococcoidia bacterium]